MSSAGGGAAWDRWGSDDERGALNLIGEAEVRAAAALVRTGRVVPLGQVIGPSTAVPPHRAPPSRFMDRDGGDYAAGAKRPGGFQFAEDTFLLATHVGTHVDALAHAWHDDQLYNGFPSVTVRSTTGAQHCGVDKLGPIVGRGVLVDLASDGPLALGQAVTRTMLEHRLADDGVALTPGDIVLVRTGWLERHAGDAAAYYAGEPGVDLEAARWLAEHDVAALGCDNFAVEQLPFPDGTVFPVHQHLLRDRGIPLIEGLTLAELAAARCPTFLFVALPLPLEGGTASPLNPVAVL